MKQQYYLKINDMKKRVFLIVLDSCGIGEMPDAADFGDKGTNTIKSISQSPEFNIINMKAMGYFNIDGVDYLDGIDNPSGAYGRLAERSKGRIVHLGVSRDVPGSRPEGDVRLKSFVELPKPCVDMQELEGFRRAGLDMFGRDEWFLHPYEGKWLLVVGNVGDENYLMVHCYDRRGGYSVFNYIDGEMVLGRCGFDEALRRCGGMVDRQKDSDQSGVSENTEASRRKLLRNKRIDEIVSTKEKDIMTV